MIKTLSKNILNETLIFTNLKAIFWKREKALIISDLHIGKAAHFRKNGIAVSSGILVEDLDNLEKLVQYFQAESILIVGDLLHAGKNSDFDIFCNWRKKFPHLKIILIKGNHDRFSHKISEEACIDIFEKKLEIFPFVFIHEPQEISDKFVISGHLHPGIVFEQKKIQRIKLPCFAYSENQLILPAFSRFTGLDYKSLNENFVKIAIHKDFIFEV